MKEKVSLKHWRLQMLILKHLHFLNLKDFVMRKEITMENYYY